MDTPSSQYEAAYLLALAAALRAEKAVANLTYDELAARSGVSKSSLLRFMKGTRDPSVATLAVIARALGVTTARLAVEAERRLPPAVVAFTPEEEEALRQMVESVKSRKKRRTP